MCCGVHYWIKIIALECIMGVQGYCMVGILDWVMVCIWIVQSLHRSGHLSIEDCCIQMHDGLFMVLHSSVCWLVNWCL